jgi:hypothetical protein
MQLSIELALGVVPSGKIFAMAAMWKFGASIAKNEKRIYLSCNFQLTNRLRKRKR